MTTLLMIGILVFGIVSYRQLPVSDLPTVDYPTMGVGASSPGASPETMAATVATPLEKAFSAIAGIDEITSNSSLGSTNITLQFALDRDLESAAQDVNAAISKTMPYLPSNMLPPSAHKHNPSSAPIMMLALTSNVLPMTQVDEFAETTIAQRLSMVEGVADVGVWGSAKYAVRVQLDPQQLASRGIGGGPIGAGGVRTRRSPHGADPDQAQPLGPEQPRDRAMPRRPAPARSHAPRWARASPSSPSAR
jgi:HAE1 family hydrophobic/amphiphilic exporter-1